MDQALICRIVEAALLAANQPLTLAQLHGLFPEDQPAPADSVAQAIESLRADSETRGVELVELASGFRYQVRNEVHAWVARLWTDRQTRYTRATLETIALIAYRQPITRGEIEQVRGVAVSTNTIKSLEEREWIRVVGHRDVPGRPALYGTTKTFLDYFGLKRLDELPPLSELKDLGELEPQFAFDGEPGSKGPIAVAGLAAATAAGSDGAADFAANDADAGNVGSNDADANDADAIGTDADGSDNVDTNADGDGVHPDASQPAIEIQDVDIGDVEMEISDTEIEDTEVEAGELVELDLLDDDDSLAADRDDDVDADASDTTHSPDNPDPHEARERSPGRSNNDE